MIMLKCIQDILQNTLKESPMPKVKPKKTRMNSFMLSKRKTSIFDTKGILGPVVVGNEKQEVGNSHRVSKIKKTYHILMKKSLSPNFDLKPQSNNIFEQIKNMSTKKQQEIFSSLFPNIFFDKTKKKKFSGPPIDKKLHVEEKVQDSSSNNFAIGWSGQAITTESLKPIVEVSSKYHCNMDPASFDYSNVKELNTKSSEKEGTKMLMKNNEAKTNKSVQLIKEIPKSHISKLHRLIPAERREKALQTSVLDDDKRSITKQICSNKTISTETNFEGQNTDDSISKKLRGKCAEIKDRSTNLDNTSKTLHPVDYASNEIGSRLPTSSQCDQINFVRNYFAESKKSENNKGLKRNEQSTLLLKSKKVEDSFNKYKDVPKRLSSKTTDETFNGTRKTPKHVTLVNSDYAKFVGNKECFLGSPSRSPAPDTKIVIGDTKEKPEGGFKTKSFKPTKRRFKNKENDFKIGASPEKIKNNRNELKEVQANKEHISYSVGKYKLKKRILKIKARLKDPKRNENCEPHRVVKPLSKILDSVVQQDRNKLEENQNNPIKELKKTRKLHSKKMVFKCSSLKMYGERENITPTPQTKETRGCFGRNLENKTNQSSNNIFPFIVQNRHVCTFQDTTSLIVNYLYKKYSTSAAKNMESNYFGAKTNNSFQKGETVAKAHDVFKVNNNLVKKNVKRTVVRSIHNPLSETDNSFKTNEELSNTNGIILKKSSEGDIPVSAGKTLTEKKDYSFEVLYERNKTTSKDSLIPNLQQKDNKLLFNKSKPNGSRGVSSTMNSGNFSHIVHDPFKYYDGRSKTKDSNVDNKISNPPNELGNALLPKEIMKTDSNIYKTDNHMSEGEKLQINNKKRTFEVSSNDFLAVKPYQSTQLTSYDKLNRTPKEPKVLDKMGKKSSGISHFRKGFLDKFVPDRHESLQNHLEPSKGIKSLPNLKCTHLGPVIGISVLKPLRWKSKSDRLNNFLLRTKVSEVRVERKRTLIKPSIVQTNTLDKLSTVVFNDNTHPGGDNNKLEFSTKNTSVQTSKSKENPISNVNSFLQNQLNPFSYKTQALKKTATVDKKTWNKDVSLISCNQKANFPFKYKLVSQTPFNCLIQNKLKTPSKSDLFWKNVSTDKVPLNCQIKKPITKPVLHANKTTVSSTTLNSSELNKVVTEQRSGNKMKNEEMLDRFLNCHTTNSEKTKKSEIKYVKPSLTVQTFTTNNEKSNQFIFKKDEKGLKENSGFQLFESKRSKNTNITKTIPKLNGMDYNLMKMGKEPKTLTAPFNSNFNIPVSIIDQALKCTKDTHNGSVKEGPKLIKESNPRQYFDELRMLNTAIPNEHKRVISVEETNQGGTHQTIDKSPSKLKRLSSFKPTLKPAQNISKPVQQFSEIIKKETNVLRKEEQQLLRDISSEPHKPVLTSPTRPLLPFDTVNRKTHLVKLKSPTISIQEQSKLIIATDGVFADRTGKKTNSKHPKFAAGLLAKHFMKTEKRLPADGNKGNEANKLKKHNTPSSSKISKSIKAKSKSEKKCSGDEKEKKYDVRKELNMITGSNLPLNCDKLMRVKGIDNVHKSRAVENGYIKHGEKKNILNGKLLQVSKKDKNKVISLKLGDNKASTSNKCLEKIVDCGVKRSRSALLHKRLMKSLKMIKSSETLTGFRKAKNISDKSSFVDSSNDQMKSQDKLSSPAPLEMGTTNFSLSCEDIGKMKNIIRSTNSFRVPKGKKNTKKRQLWLVTGNQTIAKESLQKKCEKKVQLQNKNKTTIENLSKTNMDNFIYLTSDNPQSKGVYVVEKNPSSPNDPSGVLEDSCCIV